MEAGSAAARLGLTVIINGDNGQSRRSGIRYGWELAPLALVECHM